MAAPLPTAPPMAHLVPGVVVVSAADAEPVPREREVPIGVHPDERTTSSAVPRLRLPRSQKPISL